MKLLRNIVTWIASLESGGQFRKWVSILVKILGVLTSIGAVVLGFAICVGSFEASEHLQIGELTFVAIGSILSLCVNCIFGLIFIILFWNRSNVINTLNVETHFAILPIAIVLIRLLGEFSFLYLVGTGIQSLIASIFEVKQFFLPYIQSMYFHHLGNNISIMIGVISFVLSVVTGAIILITHYIIAEGINLLLDMASNLKKIETTLSTEEAVSDTNAETVSDS